MEAEKKEAKIEMTETRDVDEFSHLLDHMLCQVATESKRIDRRIGE